MRLDKLLTELGTGSRSEVKKYIRSGLVTVNGEVVKKPEQKVDEKRYGLFSGESVNIYRV